MANVVTTQTLLDGPRNIVILLTGVLDTSNEAKNTKVDISTFAAKTNGDTPTRVTVQEIVYTVSGNLKVLLNWDATTDVTFAALSGQGELCAEEYGGIKNNAGAGVTGDIELSTAGWASGTETYTVLLTLKKV
jgi:hypothetical protein